MNKNGLQTNTEKTDDKTFCGVAQTKQSKVSENQS